MSTDSSQHRVAHFTGIAEPSTPKSDFRFETQRFKGARPNHEKGRDDYGLHSVERIFLETASCAEATTRTSSRAARVIFSRFPSRRAAASTRSAPTPRAKAPAAMKSAAFDAFTPPVGINLALGKGARIDFRYLGPPTLPQGKILISLAPWSWACISSVGVSAPGIASFAQACATESTGGKSPDSREFGAGRNAGLRLLGRSNCARSDKYVARAMLHDIANYRIALGTVIVISTIGIPAAPIASTARVASSHRRARTTGIMPISAILRTTSSIVMLFARPTRSENIFLRRNVQRSIREVFFAFITPKTSASVAMVVSPGVVMASAPCAAPHSTDHCGSLPSRNP